MRLLALLPAMAFPAILGISFACSIPPEAVATAETGPPSAQASGDDCAVIAAVAKEKYNFGPSRPGPQLRASADPGWRPECDWPSLGLSFSEGSDMAGAGEPHDRLKWVEFRRPQYDAEGASIETSQIAGPLAGAGYSCRLRSGIGGWTVTECKTIWVS